MLFVPTVNIRNRLQDGLQALGVDVPFFHSKLCTPNERDMLLGRFMAAKTVEMARIDVASKAFALEAKLASIKEMRRIATSGRVTL